MQHFQYPCFAFILALAVLFPPATSRAGDAPPKGEVTMYTFNQGKIFPGTVRSCWVYVPKQCDPAKPACLYVNQDGLQFNAPAVFDQLIHKKEMPVVIGVFVQPGVVKSRRQVE
jgi:gluconolactonase